MISDELILAGKLQLKKLQKKKPEKEKIQDEPRCPEELLDGVLWSATAATGKDVKQCPNGASGMYLYNHLSNYTNNRYLARGMTAHLE